MKKNFIAAIVVFALVACAAINVTTTAQQRSYVDFSLREIEVLATETRCYYVGVYGPNTGTCVPALDGSMVCVLPEKNEPVICNAYY
jgi:hypothetical protein